MNNPVVMPVAVAVAVETTVAMAVAARTVVKGYWDEGVALCYESYTHILE